jgi:hypothetical protein
MNSYNRFAKDRFHDEWVAVSATPFRPCSVGPALTIGAKRFSLHVVTFDVSDAPFWTFFWLRRGLRDSTLQSGFAPATSSLAYARTVRAII